MNIALDHLGLDRTEWLVLAVALVAPFAFALLLPALFDTTAGGRAGVVLIAAVTLVEVPLAALAIWTVKRRGDPVSTIGIVQPGLGWIVVFVALTAAAAYLIWARHTRAWQGVVPSGGVGALPYTTGQRVALVALGVPQIYLQELIYRSFAITFLDRATGSTAVAVAIAAGAFALAHVTSLGGNLAVSLTGVFIAGVLLGLLYTATRDLAPAFTIHWAWVAWLAIGLSE